MFDVLVAQVARPGIVERVAQMSPRTALAVILAATLVRLALWAAKAAAPSPGARTALRVFDEGCDLVAWGVGLFMFVLRPFAFQSSNVPSGSMIPALMVGDLLFANNAVYRWSEPERGDVVVFRAPADAVLPGGRTEFNMVKRVVGLPGDVVEVRGGKLIRNGRAVPEPTLGSPMPFDFKLVAYRGAEPRWKGRIVPVQIRDLFGAKVANYGTPTALRYAVAMDDRTRRYFAPDSLVDRDRRLMRELIEASPAPVPRGMLLMMGDNRKLSFDGRGWGLVPRRDVIGRAEFVWWPLGRWSSLR